ncbi:MAG: hypothetical protein ABFS21_07620 [Actinomycetota bacterium]
MRRVAILIAVAALLIVAAVPAFAAPGGEPGPPADHVKGLDNDVAEDGDDMEGPPEWAKAYGWRIKNEFGLPYGHLMMCGDEAETLPFDAELCPALPLEIPPETFGASAFWTWADDVYLMGIADAETPLIAG